MLDTDLVLSVNYGPNWLIELTPGVRLRLVLRQERPPRVKRRQHGRLQLRSGSRQAFDATLGTVNKDCQIFLGTTYQMTTKNTKVH
jgi:hypothetical protein